MKTQCTHSLRLARLRYCLVVLCCLLSIPLLLSPPALAQSGNWLADANRNCRVYVTYPGKRIMFEGKCLNGLAHGQGAVTVYGGSDSIHTFYEGYFLRGYYINSQPTGGDIQKTGRGLFYAYNPRGQAPYRMYSKVIPRGRVSVACNRTLYIATNPETSDFTADNAPLVAQKAIPLFQRLCGIFGREKVYPAITFNFVRPSFFEGTEDTPLATVTANWDGRTWQTTRPAPPAAVVSDSSTTAPVSGSNIIAAGQGLQLQIGARLIRATDTPFAACRISLSVYNNGGISVRGLRVYGAPLDGKRTRLVEISLPRKSQLVPGARATIKENLPGTVCNYVQAIRIDRVACLTRSREITNCNPSIRVMAPLPATETSNTEETGIPVFLGTGR
jgi:hypothetical protein